MLTVFIYTAEGLAEVFKPKRDPRSGIVQPKLGKGKNAGANYILRRNKQEFGLNASALWQVERQAKAFFQENAPYDVFIPQNAFFLSKLMSGEMPDKVYFGIGYNKDLRRWRDRFDFLDIFSWAKRAQDETGGPELVLWDASSYQAFNTMDPENVPTKFDEMTYSRIFTAMNKEMISNRIGGRGYDELEDFFEVTGVKGKVLSAWDLIIDKKFEKAVMESIDFCRDKKSNQIVIDRYVGGRKMNPAQRFYTPFELAEAVYLFDNEGIEFKLGPVTEQKFDSVIRDFMRRERDADYGSIWMTLPPGRRASYLDDERSVRINEPLSEIERKLDGDPQYKKWLGQVMDPFSKRTDGLQKRMYQFQEVVRK